MIELAERIVERKSFEFAIKIVKAIRGLRKDTREYELLNQLLRSGTSIGANIAEATYAQSDKDFHLKRRIALKEANETKYWLKLLRETEVMDKETADGLVKDIDELIRIITSIIRTTQEKLDQ